MMNGPTAPPPPADLPGQPLPAHMDGWLEALPDDVMKIVKTLQAHGHRAWLVGGCVRDAWLGARSGDIDLCTTCPPQATLDIFGEQAIPTGVDFGTVSVKGQHGIYELTTLRTESLYKDGRRPTNVAWGTSLREDLKRRDFTINSMAVDPLEHRLYDPHKGLNDLQNRRIRAVGRPMERCNEDALRILRAYRFWGVHDASAWTIDETLHQALVLLRSRLDLIAVERKWVELRKIILGPSPGSVLTQMQHDGVLHHVVRGLRPVPPPQLGMLDETEANSWGLHHRLATLMHHHAIEDINPVLQGLTAPKSVIQATLKFAQSLEAVPQPTTPALRVFAHAMGTEALHHATFHRLGLQCGLQHPAAEPLVHAYLDAWSAAPYRLEPVEALVDGRWLMQRTGLPSGRRLGRLKGWVHRLQIERGLSTTVEVETILNTLPFVHGDPETWPQPNFPSDAGSIFITAQGVE